MLNAIREIKIINVAKNVLAEDGSIAIRIPKDEFCNKLIYKFGRPIVSTSANMSGEKAPENFKQVSSQMLSFADYIVNWKMNDDAKGKASSIIKVRGNGEIIIIRK